MSKCLKIWLKVIWRNVAVWHLIRKKISRKSYVMQTGCYECRSKRATQRHLQPFFQKAIRKIRAVQLIYSNFFKPLRGKALKLIGKQSKSYPKSLIDCKTNKRQIGERWQGGWKDLWNFWNKFRVFEEVYRVLYRKKQLEEIDQRMQQTNCSETRIQRTFLLVLESTCTGHFRVAKIYHRAQSRFFSPGLKRDVLYWVNSCKWCLTGRGKPLEHRKRLTTRQFSHRSWWVSLDMMIPLSVSDGF